MAPDGKQDFYRQCLCDQYCPGLSPVSSVSKVTRIATLTAVKTTEQHFQGGRQAVKDLGGKQTLGEDAHVVRAADVPGVTSGGRRHSENTRSKQVLISLLCKEATQFS